jgi:tRNA modification GTPase
LSTAPGTAAVAIVRVSGPQSLPALARLLLGAGLPTSRQAALRTLWHPLTGEPLDKAMVLALPGPHTATGEDMVELHTHGSRAVVASVLRALEVLQPELGLAPALPGEFTRRGFLSGKLSLAEVEGLSDLLAAETEAQRVQAMALFGGALVARASAWRASVLRLLASLEAVLDFSPDEPDVGAEALHAECRAGAAALVGELEEELVGGERGELVRSGVKCVLFGAPNAGKSSLLNALLSRDAAIVSPRAGTTRDVLRVSLDLGGVLCTLSDTAGLREAGDEVEAEGIERARAEVSAAAVRVLVVDSALLAAALCERKGEGPTSKGALLKDLLPLPQQQGKVGSLLVVLNKCDLVRLQPEEGAVLEALERVGLGSVASAPFTLVSVSCKSGQGIGALLKALERFAAGVAWGEGGAQPRQPPLLTRARHRHAVRACAAALQRFLEVQGQAGLPELACEELRLAARALEPLIGDFTTEDLLEDIFKRFCIGK